MVCVFLYLCLPVPRPAAVSALRYGLHPDRAEEPQLFRPAVRAQKGAQPAVALGYIFGFFVLFVLSGESSAAGAGAAVRRCIPVKTACGISLVGAAQREPLWFSSVVSAYAVLVCPHGMAVGQSLVPGGSPGGKAGAGGSAARVLSAAFHRMVLGSEKLFPAGCVFLSGLCAPA